MLGRSSSFNTPASSVLLLTAAISAGYTVIMNLAFAYTVYILLPHGLYLYYSSITGERITRCESKQAAATGPMKDCTDALTWFSQVGVGLVQRQSKSVCKSCESKYTEENALGFMGQVLIETVAEYPHRVWSVILTIPTI